LPLAARRSPYYTGQNHSAEYGSTWAAERNLIVGANWGLMRRRTKPGSSIGRLAAQQIGCRDARWASGPKEWEASGFNGGRFSCPPHEGLFDGETCTAALQARSWQGPPMNPHRSPRSICSAASPSSFVSTVARHQKPSRPLPSYWELNLIQAF
jgi:hypothetical protein